MTIPFLGKTGSKGEEIARKYLINTGLVLIEANARVKGGEIDIVMHDPKTEEIVFVEVRTRTFSEFGSPEESFGPKKANSLKRSIEFYMQKFPWNTNFRLDLIAVVIGFGEPNIRHYRHLRLD